MGKISLTSAGGNGPFTVIIREVNELSGNRYTGPNPTNNLNNLDVNYIKDGTSHLYSVSISNGSCNDGTNVFEQLCPCETVPSFIASQDCTDPLNPRIAVTTSYSSTQGNFVQVKIFNSSNVEIHNFLSTAGTNYFPVPNNSSYRVSVSSGYSGLENCKAVDQIVNIACQVECTLTVSISNPVC